MQRSSEPRYRLAKLQSLKTTNQFGCLILAVFYCTKFVVLSLFQYEVEVVYTAQ